MATRHETNTGKQNGNLNVILTNNESFREPTFSELMRRSTSEPTEFKESLRKVPLPSSSATPNNQTSNTQSQFLLNSNNYPFENVNVIPNNNNKTGK